MAVVANFVIEDGPVGELRVWKRISRDLVPPFRYMFAVAMIHYIWLMLGSSLFVAPAPSHGGGKSASWEE